MWVPSKVEVSFLLKWENFSSRDGFMLWLMIGERLCLSPEKSYYPEIRAIFLKTENLGEDLFDQTEEVRDSWEGGLLSYCPEKNIL